MIFHIVLDDSRAYTCRRKFAQFGKANLWNTPGIEILVKDFGQFTTVLMMIGKSSVVDPRITVSFDHDLGNNNDPNGYDAAMWLVNNKFPYVQAASAHSMNPVGAQRIGQALHDYFASK